jgi:hypothetical protein
VTDFLLQDDATGNLICSAHITEKLPVPAANSSEKNRGNVPRRIELRWPEQKLKLALKLGDVTFNTPMPPQVFVRTQLNGAPSLDLATGTVQGSLNSVQRTRGY